MVEEGNKMKLEKVESLTGHPFLRPFEAQKSGAKIIEYRTMNTKFGENQNVVDIELKITPDKDVYLDEGTKKQEREQRLEDKKRTWFINSTSFNHLIEEFGEESDKWKDKDVEFQVEEQMVGTEKKLVIYVKDSV